MTRRVLLAGLLGGIAMYIWTAMAHMVLPLGEAGIKEIPNEPAVLAAMRASLGETSGLYLYPGFGLGPNATAQQKQAAAQQYSQKLVTNPWGILVYHPAGAPPPAVRQFVTEFVVELFESLLVVVLLAQTRLTSFGLRFAFIAAAGVMVTVWTNTSYWNWYGFPAAYTAAYITSQLVGFLCVALVAAIVLKERAPAGMKAAA